MRPEDEDANHPGYCASRCPDVVRADQRPGDPSLTISRDPDAVLSADNVGKRLAGASKMLRNDSARISNPKNVASKVTLRTIGLFTAFASLAPAASSPTGPSGEKLLRFLSCASGKCAFA
jgi:hypothetical protein